MHGHCDFMKHPMSIAGTKVSAHDRPMDRGSWADSGTKGFFINKAPEHCRNCRHHMPAANAVRTSNTADFFPNGTNAPSPDQLDTISATPLQVKELLQGNDTCDPQGSSAHALTQPLLDIQSLFGIPTNSHDSQTSKGAAAPQSKATPINSRESGPTT